MKTKTIELIISTSLQNQDIIKIMDNGTENLKELEINIIEIRIKNSADSRIKGFNYND